MTKPQKTPPYTSRHAHCGIHKEKFWCRRCLFTKAEYVNVSRQDVYLIYFIRRLSAFKLRFPLCTILFHCITISTCHVPLFHHLAAFRYPSILSQHHRPPHTTATTHVSCKSCLLFDAFFTPLAFSPCAYHFKRLMFGVLLNHPISAELLIH